MKKRIALALFAGALAGSLQAADSPRMAAGAAGVSGVETQYIESTIRAADDFNAHANGKWLATTTIPADKPSWSPTYVLHEDAQEKLRIIIDEAAGSTSAAPNDEARKVGELYRTDVLHMGFGSNVTKPQNRGLCYDWTRDPNGKRHGAYDNPQPAQRKRPY